jgi:TM2 domain-containing membrane protein YozV
MSELPTYNRANPTVAALLTWLIPGAGHLYMGRVRFGLVAFVLVEAVFGAGFLLSDGRTWEFLVSELRGPFATLLAPEAGHLGGWLAVKELRNFGPPYPRPFPEWMALGSMLMAAAGVMNACLMARAHLDARRTSLTSTDCDAGVATFAAFLVPGLGHFLQGRKRRAVMVAVLLIGFFVLGTLLAEGTNLSRERHFYYWGGQFFLGLPAALTELVSGHHPVTREIPLMDVGLLFASLAGLLNVLAMLDVYAWGDDRAMGRDPVASRRNKHAEKRS